MNRAKGIVLAVMLTGLLIVASSCGEPVRPDFVLSVPVAGNSWVVNDLSLNARTVTRSGIVNWGDEEMVINTYFRTAVGGEVHLALVGRALSGESVVNATVGGKSRRVKISNSEFDTIFIGSFSLDRGGYHALELRGVKRSDSLFAEVKELLIGGVVTSERVWFVKDDFHFGRRGPSVHLRYHMPPDAGDIVLFYSTITVPEGSDVPGSFYMANGFNHGYFGIQVNSDTERRVLFSVWSPYQTDNPREIPPEYQIIELAKGEDVIARAFGNEGSGGQSFLRYNWKAGTEYGFLLRGVPSVNRSTDYTAWFYAPEVGEWQLIASFRRPKTENYLLNFHSFLENFRTETGVVTREAHYSNQWVMNVDNKWFELTEAVFTADATAAKEARMDYSGGVAGSAFFLRNCGFFDDNVEVRSRFMRGGGTGLPDSVRGWQVR